VTRNIYINLCRKIIGHDRAILFSLISVGLGGFVLLLVMSQLLESTETIISMVGRLWFSVSAILSALYLVTQWFNPERDKADISSNESFLAMLINFILFIAIYSWLME